MKAITLHQPWASLWVHGIKINETRGWRTNYRGQLAVHAAKHADPDEEREILNFALRCADVQEYYWLVGQIRTLMATDLPRGMILGTVDLTDCLLMDAALVDQMSALERAVGNWQEGRFAWRAANPRPFREPVPVRGKQGLWNWIPPADFNPMLGAAT